MPLTPLGGPEGQTAEKQPVSVLRATWVSDALVPSCQKHSKTNRKQALSPPPAPAGPELDGTRWGTERDRKSCSPGAGRSLT